MAWWEVFPALLAILAVILSGFCGNAQVLNPPYFNLAEGKTVYSTATCGERVSDREWFCKLTGANYAGTGRGTGSIEANVPLQQQGQIVQGQLCDYCDHRDSGHAHPPSFAVDGTERWWQSPPLSRGVEYNEVNLTVDLGQEFHVAYVFIKMANSPRPGVWALERSTDYGQAWKPWQYFADTPSDCMNFFNTSQHSIETDDSVICTTGFSKVVPLEGGEIVVSLVNDRPNANNFSYATTLQDWTIATNVRLRLLRTKTLLGHLMAVARQDPTVTRRYYYSIKDISIGGRCVCNGHAEFCDKRDPRDPEKLLCRCQHNTCGPQCETCCAGFVQKRWKKATEDSVNECEPCNCHNHSSVCYYDESIDVEKKSLDIYGKLEGGGVCQNCQHNTQGINCHECKPGFYRPDGVPMESPNACRECQCNTVFSTGECEPGTGKCSCRRQYAGDNCDRCALGYYGYPTCVPCTCNVNGTENNICEVGGGQCPCKPNYIGANCDQCNFAFYGFPECKSCKCNPFGSINRNCDIQSGQCPCRSNFGNRTCDVCTDGYFGFPTCEICTCDPTGCEAEICNKTDGRCLCKENFGGAGCDRCALGYYNYPTCAKCGCATPGSQSEACDNTGQCQCHINFAGTTCDRCAPGYYKYPECKPCSCDIYGSTALSCHQEEGQCNCRANFQGLMCNKCKEGYYNYPVCEECNCNPAGAKEIAGLPLGGCGTHQNGQLCECKERVTGHTCDACKPGFWNLNINNAKACDKCDCDIAGTIGGSEVCDLKNGQCLCKLYTEGRRCSKCKDGFYRLTAKNIFGCVDCNCDIGGAWDNNCDKVTGQCRCRPRVTGKTCNRPDRTHFYPNLHQKMFEMEDGRTPTGGSVRFGFDANIFPDYSWRGYAIFSRVQPTIVVDVQVDRPDVYHVMYRYVNRNLANKPGTVRVTPESATDDKQKSSVIFQSTTYPLMAAVTMGTVPTGFVMNPGKWSISLTTGEDIFVDYVALLPESYFGAAVLKQRVKDACPVPLQDHPCIHYVYVDVTPYKIFRGENGYYAKDQQRVRTQVYDNADILKDLDAPSMAVLDLSQTGMYIDLIGLDPDQYVLVLNYLTPDGKKDKEQVLDVNLASTVNRDKGKVTLPPCKFSSLCRAVVTNVTNGRVGFYDISTDYATLSFAGEDNVNVAIDSVVAVPRRFFNVNFLQPTFKCVMVNKKCVGSQWLSEASVKIELEGGETNIGKITKPEELPPGIIDVGVKVIKLDKVQPVIKVNGSVSRPGQYTYMLHYYQPKNPTLSVNVEVEVGGKVYPGVFKADYCPSVTGCRGLITFEGKDAPDSIDLEKKDFKVVLNNTVGTTVWLDYFVIIPTSKDKNEYLNWQPIDNSGYFLTECAADGFDVKQSASEFCKTAVFSITTDYNNGAQECKCHIDGSKSFECSEYGGQCQCKPNVIGRKCTQCKTGYYGFPDCKPCNCPSGLCHHKTGKCICPPRVTGENCNICLANTFGYDPLIGCEECNCQPEGVKNNNMSCNVNTGQCSCKENINARTCSVCKAGFYGFPRCAKCNCDARGTTEDVCDQRTAQCICKENVEGNLCDRCKAGSYFLEERNPLGCTKCFCFGTTDRCRSSSLKRDYITTMVGWNVTNIDDPQVYEEDRKLTLDARKGARDTSQPMYWVAPKEYLGNRVTSYGGRLTYSIYFLIPSDQGSRGKISSDLILVGNNMTISHVVSEQPAVGKELLVRIFLTENKFNHESTGAYVSRSQFMSVLSRLEAMHIRVNYYTVIERASLTDVRLDSASPDGPGEVANNVEECYCPPSYTGTSCEECVEGYYKHRNGTGFVCMPCQCNGNAASCDRETGECIDCRYNTKGFHCDECVTGYYKDKDTGRCNICACPKPLPSNNFATTCEVIDDNVVLKCECLPGYSGPRCDACESGFYGNPSEVGGSCQPCQCSDNIDLNDPGSCDPLTGACLKCLYNTTGPSCDKCGQWLYGDALDDKECQPCSCDQCGTEFCDDTNGVCNCLPNVVGADCHECAPYTYGFDECEGCKPCECGAASERPQCNDTTGECACRPGVMGKKCNECMEGYWNYGPNGCQECQCAGIGATTCDRVTGVCRCKEGHMGRDCNQCITGWIMVPEKGCQECDNCVFLLLHDIDYIINDLTTRERDLEDVSVGVFAMRRLTKINDTVNRLRPEVDNMVVDPNQIDIKPLRRLLIEVKNIAKTTETKIKFTKTRSEIIIKDGEKVKNESLEILTFINETQTVTNEAVDYVREVLKSIQDGIRFTNIEQLLDEAEKILKEIKERDFSSKSTGAQDELEKAVELLERVKALSTDTMKQQKKFDEVYKKLNNFEDKLKDLRDQSRKSLQTSMATVRNNQRNRAYLERIKGTVERIIEERELADGMIKMGQDLIKLAREYLDQANRSYKEVETESTRLDDAMEKLTNFTENLARANERLRPLVDNATDHSLDLEDEASYLRSLIRDTERQAKNALRAAQAYENIVTAIQDAAQAATDSINATGIALEMSSGLGDRANASKAKSQELLERAKALKIKVEGELQDQLNRAVKKVDDLETKNGQVRNGIEDIERGLNMLPADGYSKQANDSAMRSMDAQTRSEEVITQITSIQGRIEDDLERSKQIKLAVDEANDHMNAAKDQVLQVQKLVPDASKLLDRLQILANKIDSFGNNLRMNISALKEKITITRGRANEIRVAMEFFQNTTVQARNPRNLNLAGSFTKLSMYFKTSEPNGLLMYVGPDQNDPSASNDYMSVEILNGNVVFKYDLGSGPAQIRNSKYVDDGKWHQVIVERIGRTGKVTVRTEDEPDMVDSGESPGTKAVLELDRDKSKFFIGGVADTAQIPAEVGMRRFIGGIEDVLFEGVPVGLWNFVKGDNNNRGYIERDTLQSAPTNGFRFNGNSYIVLPKGRFRPHRKSQVTLMFKTYSDNGLLFFASQQRDFISVELKDGKVLFQYDLGGGRAKLESTQKYNDGAWHSIDASRRDQKGLLKVDDVKVAEGQSVGDLTQLSITDEIHIGGYRGTEIYNFNDVTSLGFDGCIKDVQLSKNARDLNTNIIAKNVIRGCPEQVARIVSFEASKPGFAALQPININRRFDATMKIKTLEQESLLMYAANADQSNSLSLSVVDGKIVMVSVIDGVREVIRSKVDTYNDGRWHYLTITKDGATLQMDIDDSEMVKGDLRKKRIKTTSKLYFGGVPSNYAIQDLNSATLSRLIGCIGDVTVKGNFVNFAKVPPGDRVGSSLASCPIKDPAAPTELPGTIEPPIIPILPTGTVIESDKCVLSPAASAYNASGTASGIRFGFQPESRVEYDKIPGNSRIKSEFSVEFKTTAEDGLIFYVADDRHQDYFLLMIKNGEIVYAFNSGSGAAVITSSKSFNDGKWHRAVFWRQEKNGRLTVDDQAVYSGTSQGSTRSINIALPYYVGGLPEDTAKAAVGNLGRIAKFGFTGCIRNFKINGKLFGPPKRQFGTQPCYPNVEVGSFFGAAGGYLVANDNFKVGLDLDILVEIRPRSQNGVIMSVSSKRGDFLVLQIVEGELLFSVDNGAGKISAKFKSLVKPGLCDGKWHTIHAVKAKNVVTLKVDGVYTSPGIGAAGVSSTDTNDPLHIGGVPDPLNAAGVETAKTYAGCIRNLQFDQVRQNIAVADDDKFGDVNTGHCPIS